MVRQLLDQPHTDHSEGRKIAGVGAGDTHGQAAQGAQGSPQCRQLQLLSLGAALQTEAARANSAMGRAQPPPLLVKALALPPPPQPLSKVCRKAAQIHKGHYRTASTEVVGHAAAAPALHRDSDRCHATVGSRATSSASQGAGRVP